MYNCMRLSNKINQNVTLNKNSIIADVKHVRLKADVMLGVVYYLNERVAVYKGLNQGSHWLRMSN